MSTQEALMQIGLMIVLVALSAFFSATETAFSSLNRARLKSLAEHGKKRAADALALALCHARSFTSRLPKNGDVKETI